MKKIVGLIISGITVGITIGYIIALLFSSFYSTNYFYPSSPSFVRQFNSPLTATLVSTILWALMGICFRATSLVFQNSWGITRQTLIHLLITYLVFTPLAVLAGWFPATLSFMLWYSGEFLLIYVIIWGIFMYVTKRKVQALNQSLARRKSN